MKVEQKPSSSISPFQLQNVETYSGHQENVLIRWKKETNMKGILTLVALRSVVVSARPQVPFCLYQKTLLSAGNQFTKF